MKEKQQIIKKLELVVKYFIMFAKTKGIKHYQRQNIITYLEDLLDEFNQLYERSSNVFGVSEMLFLEFLGSEMNNVVFNYAYKGYDITLDHKDDLLDLCLNTFKEKTLKELKMLEGVQSLYQPEFFSYHLDGYKNDKFLTLEGAMFTYVDREEKDSLEDVRDFLIKSSSDFNNINFDKLEKYDEYNVKPKNRVTLKHINADKIKFFKPGHFILINPGYVKIKVKEFITLKDGEPKRGRKVSYYNENFEYLEYNDTKMKIDDQSYYTKDKRVDAIRNTFNECISMLEEESEVRKKL